MGRIFETRKHVMFARYARMSKAFNRIRKEIEIAVKSGGPDTKSNSKLRIAIQNAKSVNMPKDKIDAAINVFAPFGIKELARSGVVAIKRGEQIRLQKKENIST